MLIFKYFNGNFFYENFFLINNLPLYNINKKKSKKSFARVWGLRRNKSNENGMRKIWKVKKKTKKIIAIEIDELKRFGKHSTLRRIKAVRKEWQKILTDRKKIKIYLFLLIVLQILIFSSFILFSLSRKDLRYSSISVSTIFFISFLFIRFSSLPYFF